MPLITIGSPGAPLVDFQVDNDSLFLRSLFGLLCGTSGEDSGQIRVGGPALVCTDGTRIEGAHWKMVDLQNTGLGLDVRYLAGDGIELRVQWTLSVDTGVLVRRDSITNTGSSSVTVRRSLSRMALQPGAYEIYCQSGRWATENQGRWVPLHSGSIVLGCEAGRTTQGSTPYACIRDTASGRGIALHLIPTGNWTIRISARQQGNNQAYCVIEAGLSDEDLHLSLEPGQSLALPELLVQALPDGRPERAAPDLHRHVQRTMLANAKPEAPVIWNTWIDQFDNLDVDRLRKQLAVVKEMGCEVLVIDAGWFGENAGSGAWYELAGDWRECTTRGFKGRMKEFADEVRAAGLGFGLWMEPEHVGKDAPVRRANPQWFKGGDSDPRIDLENPAAYAFVKSEICRLVQTYGLIWLKIDFNTELGIDESGKELIGYYQELYRMLEDVKAAYPGTFFEGCSSGGMRCDLSSLTHHDDHFLSDTTHPVDVIRISEGATLRLPPGRIGKWLVMRSIGRTVPEYPGTVADAPESLATAPSSGWQPRQLAETFDLDFATIAAMPGVFGLSGDPSSMSAQTRSAIGQHIAFYKQWRRFILASHARLLTEVRPIGDRNGWSVVQLSIDGSPQHLVFSYRLMDSSHRRRFRLGGLDPAATYELSVYPSIRDGQGVYASGAALMGDGLDVMLPHPASASVTVVRSV